jgi:Autotransporter beta-domain
MRVLRWMVLLLAAWTGAVNAQSPDTSLAASWNAVCAGAPPSSALATRCAEIFSGGPNSRQRAAGGNSLGEIPGQGRAATRDGAPDDDALRTDLGAGWALFASVDTGRLERRDGTNEAPFDGDTGSVSAGVDWTPAANWQLGLLANHTRDELDFVFSRGSLRTTFTGAMVVDTPGRCGATTGCAGRSTTPCSAA